MADEKHVVEYQYTGDTSSLEQATQKAIDQLSEFNKAMNSVKQDTNLTNLNNSFKTLNDHFKEASQSLKDVKTQINNVGSVNFNNSNTQINSMKNSAQTLSDSFIRANQAVSQVNQTMRSSQATFSSASSSIGNYSSRLDAAVSSGNRFANSTNSTNSNITMLVQNLNKIKTNVSNVFTKYISEIQKAISESPRLQSVLTGLKTVAQEVSSKAQNLAGNIASMFSKMQSSAPREASDDLNRVGQSVRSLNQELANNTQNLSTQQTAFNDLAGGASTASTSFMAVDTAARTLTRAGLKLLKTALNGLVKGFQNIVSLSGKAITSFAKLTTKILGFDRAAKKSASSTNLWQKAMSHLSALSLGKALEYSAMQAIDLIENLNLFQVAMGKSYDKALLFVDKMADLYGMNPSNLYRYTGMFYQLTNAIGMSNEASQALSLSMTKMSNDIASLFNMDIETVVDNLSSALQGSSRAVSKYGIDVRKAAIQQTAYEYGITQSVSSLSEANKQALRYLTIHKQVTNAIKQEVETVDEYGNVIKTTWGDFARNIETPANQMRIFKEQIQKLGAAIGAFLVRPLAIALAYINGFIMALEKLISWIAGLLGLLPDKNSSLGFGSAFDDASDSIEDVGDAAEKTKKEVSDLLAPFDELNILAETASDSASNVGDFGLDPRLEEAIKNAQLGLEDFETLANRIRDAILRALGLELTDGELRVIEGGLVDQIIKAFKAGDFEGIGKAIGEWINKGIYFALDNIPWDDINNKLVDFMTKFARILNGLVDALDFEALGKLIARFTNWVLHAFEAFLETFDWNNLGRKLGDAISGFLLEVDIESAFVVFADKFLILPRIIAGIFDSMQDDWDQIGIKLGLGINSALDRIIDYINDFNWYNLSKAFSGGLEKMFTTIDTSKAINAIAGAFKLIGESLKGFIDGLFTPELASKFVAGFNGIIQQLNSWISSNSTQGTSANLSKFIQRCISGIDWASLGSLLGKSFQAMFRILEDIVIDFAASGRSVQAGLYNMISSIDWNALGQTLGSAVSLIFGAIGTAIESINWSTFAAGLQTGFSTLIVNLDANQVAAGLSNFLDGAFRLIGDLLSPDGLIMTLTDILIDAFANIDWGQVAFSAGIAIIQAALSVVELGINSIIYPLETAINSILTTLGMNTIDMTGAVSSAFDSASQSLREWANTAREQHFGVTENVKQNTDNLNQYIYQKNDELTSDVIATGQEINNQLITDGALQQSTVQLNWDGMRLIVDTGMNAMLQSISTTSAGFKDAIDTGLQATKEAVSSAFNEVVQTTENTWSTSAGLVSQFSMDMKTYASVNTSELRSSVENNFDAVKSNADINWSAISSLVTQNVMAAKIAVSTNSNEMKAIVQETNGTIQTDTNTKWANIRTTVQTNTAGIKTDTNQNLGQLKTDISNTWGTVQTDTATKWNGIRTTVVNAAQNTKTQSVSAFEGIKSAISNVWSSLVSAAKSWGSDLMNSIVSGIKSNVSKVTEAVKGVANNVKSYLGFSEPKEGPLSNFHTYMPDMMKLMSQGISQNADLVIGQINGLSSIMQQSLSRPIEVATGNPIVEFNNEGNRNNPYDIQEEQNNPEENQKQPIDVKVYIGDSEWDTFTYESSERGKKLSGLNPIRS